MWGKVKERVAPADVMSAAAVQQFFNMIKLETHFRRTTAGSVKITISSAVGKLISILYEMDNYSELATDDDVRLKPVLRPTPPADGDDSDSSDSVHNPTAAELHCRRAFKYCVSLIRFGLSYRQIASVKETMRSILPDARSEFIPVTRQLQAFTADLLLLAGWRRCGTCCGVFVIRHRGRRLRSRSWSCIFFHSPPPHLDRKEDKKVDVAQCTFGCPSYGRLSHGSEYV
jgi:hypothetical protein